MAAACTVELLDAPAGGSADARAVDPGGRTVVGTVSTAAGQRSPVRFEGGHAVPYAGVDGDVVAVNASGLLVGYSTVEPGSRSVGWTYTNGSRSTLAKLPGYDYTAPRAVNTRGDVVGSAEGVDGEDDVPVLWPADHPGTVRALVVPARLAEPLTFGSRAIGVAEDGTVVGTVRGVAVRWAPDGTPSALPLPPGYEHAGPAALRGRTVYGWASIGGADHTEAVRWDLDSGTVKIVAGAPFDVTAGTPSGAFITGGGDDREPSRVTADGTVETLPPVGDTGSYAASVSDDGSTIVGATWGEHRRPVIWHC